MLAKALIIAGLVSAGLLLILLTTTTPTSSGAFGILAVFLLSYVVALVSVTFLLWFTALVINKVIKRARITRKPYVVTLKKSYYYASVIALGPVIMVSLQSVGGVGLYEIGLMILFIVLGCIYVSRRTA